jgi:hypothetical protein
LKVNFKNEISGGEGLGFRRTQGIEKETKWNGKRGPFERKNRIERTDPSKKVDTRPFLSYGEIETGNVLPGISFSDPKSKS